MGTSVDRVEAVRPNEVWAMDFVHDQLAAGKKLRVGETRLLTSMKPSKAIGKGIKLALSSAQTSAMVRACVACE